MRKPTTERAVGGRMGRGLALPPPLGGVRKPSPTRGAGPGAPLRPLNAGGNNGQWVDAAADSGCLRIRELQRHLRERGELQRQLEQHAARQQQLRRSLHEACCQCLFLSDDGDAARAQAPVSAPVTFVRAVDLLEATFAGRHGQSLARRGAKIDAAELADIEAAAKALRAESCRNTSQKMFCLVQLRKFLSNLDREAARVAGVMTRPSGRRRPTWADGGALVAADSELESVRRVWCFRCGEGPFIGERACGNCATILHYGARDNTDNLMYLEFVEHAAQRDLVVAQRRTEILERAERLAAQAVTSLLRPQPLAVGAQRTLHRHSLHRVSIGGTLPERPYNDDPGAPQPSQPGAGNPGQQRPSLRRGSRTRLGSLGQQLQNGATQQGEPGSAPAGDAAPSHLSSVSPPCGPAPSRQPGALRGSTRRAGRPSHPGLAPSSTQAFVQSLAGRHPVPQID